MYNYIQIFVEGLLDFVRTHFLGQGLPLQNIRKKSDDSGYEWYTPVDTIITVGDSSIRGETGNYTTVYQAIQAGYTDLNIVGDTLEDGVWDEDYLTLTAEMYADGTRKTIDLSTYRVITTDGTQIHNYTNIRFNSAYVSPDINTYCYGSDTNSIVVNIKNVEFYNTATSGTWRIFARATNVSGNYLYINRGNRSALRFFVNDIDHLVSYNNSSINHGEGYINISGVVNKFDILGTYYDYVDGDDSNVALVEPTSTVLRINDDQTGYGAILNHGKIYAGNIKAYVPSTITSYIKNVIISRFYPSDNITISIENCTIANVSGNYWNYTLDWKLFRNNVVGTGIFTGYGTTKCAFENNTFNNGALDIFRDDVTAINNTAINIIVNTGVSNTVLIANRTTVRIIDNGTGTTLLANNLI